MNVKSLLTAICNPARMLAVGSLLLAAHAGQAQNSFNVWEAKPVTKPEPAARPARKAAPAAAPLVAPAATPAPAFAPAAATAPNNAQALPKARRKTQDSLQVAKGYSMTLRRGLGERLRRNRYSKADSAYYMFTWQHLHYPSAALHAGLAGQVMVRLNVSPAGDVTNSEVTGTSIQQESQADKGASAAAGKEAMQRSAKELLWRLRFEPASGATQEEIPVRYVLQ
ncbi:TonB family protein [Hymenobacter sp. BT491]|uniref:TonB family protein n=1 Tax=Hymenobacter sp. BT491 TaxID=2766779 RepID=UPI001653C552|nr:TonB family protein [Hymenobacter sp. BT491]MBC6989843.1 TonB family protein [Hymenobacter sp. BT491]